jgi:hypothetical protein
MTIEMIKIKTNVAALLQSQTYPRRFYYSHRIAQLFCEYFSLSYCKILLLDEPQPETVYGEYSNKTIKIYNLTTKRKQPIKTSSLLDTLIHELMHHYDQFTYGNEAQHGNGFYKRVKEFKELVLKEND